MNDFVPAPGRLPDCDRVYAIGDVHGCAAQLVALHEMIAADAAAHPAARVTVLHLGDYVDRGPDSAGAVAAIATSPVPGAALVNLMGNHERMMLDALDGATGAVGLWLRNGGATTLDSYGLADTPPELWAGRMPADALARLRGLAMQHRLGTYLFVHAGVRPGLRLEDQRDEDRLWIREPFLLWPGPYPGGVAVVHGHTPVSAPQVLSHRIAVDTGAVTGRPLTCAVLEGSQVRFLRANPT